MTETKLEKTNQKEEFLEGISDRYIQDQSRAQCHQDSVSPFSFC